ncbi:MAG: thiol peroxidase [Deltaproteobacteria bacterium]|nr:thiol peroxidase [Deltaproteobacteria bacterium]
MSKIGTVTSRGNALSLVGTEVSVGDAAPDFTLYTNDMKPAKLSDYAGKTLLVATVPSLDTGVCDKETRRFNEEAAALGDGVQVLTVSHDLPFAQKRWCGAAGVDRVQTLSAYRGPEFGQNWGVLVEEIHLLARAVFVVGPDGKIAYKQIVPEITEEPDYAAAIAAAKAAAG